MTGLATGTALLLWAVVGGSGLRVDTATPDALCPDLGQVRAAARARLGDIEGDGDWNALYALIHRPDGAEAGDVVRLELHDPTGRLRLRRELPRAGESCASLAQALVVILDAYFRHPTDAEDAVAAAPAPVARTAPVDAVPASPPPDRFVADLSAGWASAWGGGDQASPVLALGVRVALLPPAWWAGVEGSWLTSAQSHAVGVASASARSFGVRAFVARDVVQRPGAGVLVGPEVMVALDRADAGMLLEGERQTRARFGAGLRAQLQLRLARPLWLSVLATFDYAPAGWGGTFLIADQSAASVTEIFPPSRLRLMVGAGLSWAVF
jgi:hypothetical protein